MNTIALVLCSSALLPAAADWSALPLPSLCAPPAPHAHPPALWEGSHIRPLTSSAESPSQAANPRLATSVVEQMLAEHARARGGSLEFFRGSPLLLARGDAPALEAARALLADLERQSRQLEIELSVRVQSLPASGAPGGAAPGEQRARVSSGEEACFGSRATESFVESFSVEVAADSGVCRPQVSTLATGTTLHVRAARVSEGQSIFLGGLFDHAVLLERASFDPDTNDLGKLDMPRLDVQQVAFAGVVPNGGSLELELCARTGGERWKVSIRATTQAAAEERESAGWKLFDLAFLALDGQVLPRLGPGALLGGEFRWNEEAPQAAALPPSALAAALEDGRASGSSSSARATASVYWTDELLFLPRSDAALLARAAALVRAAESLRSRGGLLEVQQSGLEARIPVLSGFPARLVAGSERTWLLGYRTELAPQSWMPVPEISSGFDGLCLGLVVRDEGLTGSAWSVRSEAPREVARQDARLGRMQCLSREIASARFALHTGESEQRLLPGGSLRLVLAAR